MASIELDNQPAGWLKCPQAAKVRVVSIGTTRGAMDACLEHAGTAVDDLRRGYVDDCVAGLDT